MTMASFLAHLRRSDTGVAMIELAYSLPIVVPLFLGGVELTNYAITRMQVSQVALHVADNASRIGTDSLLTAPQISEGQINDLFIGANLQAGNLDLANNGRVFLSSIEPDDDPETDDTYRIHWQRCFGNLDRDSTYGEAGDTAAEGFGPSDRKTSAPDGGATMFVEVVYRYTPLVSSSFISGTDIKEIAAMTVRDDRDYVGPDTDDDGEGPGVYPTTGVTASTCA